MQSALYEGFVVHRRREPVEHSFRYRVSMAYVDLDEVDEVAAACRPLWGEGRFAPVQLRRTDYHGDPDVPLADAIRALTGERSAPVRMLTNPRMLGHCFNPVTFYWCGEAVVAEVTNTPWGERHAYVLRGQDRRFEKRLHVSPFMGMDHEYECEAPLPGENALLRVVSRRAERTVFEAVLALRRRELSRSAVARMLLCQPAARVLPRIYTQALRLKLKGAPYFPHPRSAA